MVYTALPDRRISYDNDGTVSGWWYEPQGIVRWLAGSEALRLNSFTPGAPVGYYDGSYIEAYPQGTIHFFPEQREVTALYLRPVISGTPVVQPKGSNDTTNGQDGTWEAGSMPGGSPVTIHTFNWRDQIKPVSFTGGKKVLRVVDAQGNTRTGYYLLHLYGEKVTGQTPDDLLYINHDDTPGVEYATDDDFGDQPLGTTLVRQFRLKNTSPTKTATTINVQCNDADFVISTDGTTWVVTISIASLGPGAESATLYVRCTTPAPGNLLGPRFARIVTTVASYS